MEFITSDDFASLLCFYIDNVEMYHALSLVNKTYYRIISKHRSIILDRCSSYQRGIKCLGDSMLIHQTIKLCNIAITFQMGKIIQIKRLYPNICLERSTESSICYHLLIYDAEKLSRVVNILFLYDKSDKNWYLRLNDYVKEVTYNLVYDGTYYRLYPQKISTRSSNNGKAIKALPKKFKIFDDL